MKKPKNLSTEPTESEGQNYTQDYSTTRNNFYIIALAAGLTVFVMEFIMYWVLRFQGATIPDHYLLLHWMIPSLLNAAALTFVGILMRKSKQERVLNYAPIGGIIMMATVVAATHNVYAVTMVGFCVPLFMAAIYGDSRMCWHAFVSALAGLVVAMVFRAFIYPQPNDTRLIPEALITVAFLLLAQFTAIMFVRVLTKQREMTLQSMMRAQAANQAKSDFLANMSHEIRTPLNAVIGMTEMITRTTKEDTTREYAGDIQQAGNALLALINDILDISKIESGNIEIQESNYELGSLINDSYNIVAARWREKGLTAAVICNPNLPRLLCGDEYHLRQIIVNLLSNAIKYTNEGGVQLIVDGENDGTTLRMEVRVKDSGIGIRQEDIPNLFKKFSRFDMDNNRQVEGSGLGLSITKRLVELMGGTIEVESVYGLGSCFTVRIPQKVADNTPIGDICKTYLNMHGEVEQYHQSFEAPSAKILVVDDVAVNLQVFCKLLQSTKIQIDTAQSGLECLRKARATRYDIIFMDHMMPEMDGVETLKAMRALDDSLNKDVPVIMLTANAMLGAREDYLNRGFVDYLSKPVRGARIESMILKYLPTEKVVLSETVQAQAAAASFSFDELKLRLPELDTIAGLSYCAADENFYRSMLVEYATSDRGDRLQKAFVDQNSKEYQLEVHSLKSSSKMVGLTELSEEFLRLEQAIKAADYHFIVQNHPVVMEHFHRVVEVLKNIKL